MRLNYQRYAALLLLSFFLLSLVFFKADAALLPEEQHKMQEEFLKAADVTAIISLSKTEQEFLCGVKSLFKASCECVSVYQIKEVVSQPQGFTLQAGDTLILDYPCDKDKRIQWVGSFVAWTEPKENGLLLMKMQSRYLRRVSRARWIIDNSQMIFKP